MRESLRIEISQSRPDEWRVVERSHHAAESVFRVQFNATELSELLAEIHGCLLDANVSAEAQISRLRRLGGRLAEMMLPRVLREKVSNHIGAAEFFLDDASVMLPVELYPNGDGVLGEAMPVSRHWFCEGSRAAPKQAALHKNCQALIVADPAENLPSAQQEGKSLFRKLRSQKGWKCRYFGRAMTAAGMSREQPDTDVLHLAAHYVAGDNQTTPGVMMADGPWLPGEAFSTPEMVFANCCHAGLPVSDNGSLSLAGNFLKHGSRHVIAPFLPVCDRAAGEFAREFYQAFLTYKDAAQAVWSAKRAVGPASWMYWHFGPASEEPIREIPPTRKEKRSCFWIMIFLLALIVAAVAPWMKPVDRVSTHSPEPIAIGKSVASAPVLMKEESVGIASEPIPLVPNTAELESERNIVDFPAAESKEKATLDESAIKTISPEPAPVAEQAADPESLKTSAAVRGEAVSIGNTDPKKSEAVARPAATLEASEPLAVIPPETHSDSNSDKPKPVSVEPQTLPIPAQPPAASEKPGLFDKALTEIDRQQSFEEAAIQVLNGYPERYLKATITGKPDYNATTGKASINVEVTIDNAEYRTMAQRLSEVLRKFGHDGEHISATMERPYDYYMEIRFRFSGRKKFRDLLFLCIRANDALTQSEWEFHSLPRSSIDALLSSMSMPLLSVELTDSVGQTIASASQKIPRPFLATEDRGFSILPAFNGERSEMRIASVIPGRNRLEVKLEFYLSLEELKRIRDAVCTIKKGTRLPDEFTYRFLK